LSISQNGVSPIDYPYYWAVPANTGMPSGTDLNNNGKTDDAADCFGFGTYKGQYAFAIFSKFPIKKEQVRSFQKFLWKDMPNANFPIIPSTKKPYYSQEAMNVIRLSSKNHIDVPIAFPNKKEIHLLVSHPTPPVFDGDEDRNGMRNHDEIRLFADYITSGKEASYIYDDKGEKGGIAANTHFVIMGDLNADPIDGGSYQSAIKQLLNNEKVNQEVAWGKFIPMSKGSTENSQKERFKNHKGNPNTDTSAWGLRVDYALPSANLKVKNTGVFWVDSKDSLNYLINDTKTSSDHRLVWLTIED